MVQRNNMKNSIPTFPLGNLVAELLVCGNCCWAENPFGSPRRDWGPTPCLIFRQLLLTIDWKADSRRGRRCIVTEHSDADLLLSLQQRQPTRNTNGQRHLAKKIVLAIPMLERSCAMKWRQYD
jgi:hypothetical protein